MMAECISIVEFDRLEGLLAPMIKMMGGKYKRPKVRRPPSKAEAKAAAQGSKTQGTWATSVDYNDPASVARAQARDARILEAAGSWGRFGIGMG